jgi:hypothetical protein
MGPDTTLPIGVYRGASPDITRVQDYEAFLGIPAVDYVLAFMADSPTWPQFEQAILQSSTNGGPGAHSATEWAPLLGGRTLMLAVPACVQGTTWAAEASGANDTHWAALAQTLVGAGLGNSVLRIAREFSGGWYHWSVSPGNAADHKAGWARIVSVMRNAGFTGKFMWNPYLGQGTFGPSSDPSSAYPGDASVDVIGLDFYDGGYPAGETIRTIAQQQAAWASMRDQWAGLTGWLSFAQGRHKPLAYPEWGLRLWNDNGKYVGGGDNPVLIGEMAAWMLDTGAWMHALWEDPNRGVADPDSSPGRQIAVPQARAAFLAAFGNS